MIIALDAAAVACALAVAQALTWALALAAAVSIGRITLTAWTLARLAAR